MLQRLLQKHPKDRFASCQEVMDHPFFASVDWDAMKEHRIKAVFRPLDIIKVKFF